MPPPTPGRPRRTMSSSRGQTAGLLSQGPVQLRSWPFFDHRPGVAGLPVFLYSEEVLVGHEARPTRSRYGTGSNSANAFRRTAGRIGFGRITATPRRWYSRCTLESSSELNTMILPLNAPG